MRVMRVWFFGILGGLLMVPQVLLSQSSFSPDITTILHESTLNKFVSTLGSVKGDGSVNVQFRTIDYRWTVKNPRISLTPEKAVFLADVDVDLGFYRYKTEAEGSATIQYDDMQNTISITVNKADFKVTASLFGQSIDLKTIDLSDSYQSSIVLKGPEPIQQTVQLDLGNNQTKTVQMTSKRHRMNLDHQKLVFDTELAFK